MTADMESEKELMNKAKRSVNFRLCRVSGYLSLFSILVGLNIFLIIITLLCVWICDQVQ